MEKLAFKQFTNNGISGATINSTVGQIIAADYYTIEHGVNDWGHSTPVGTMDDYTQEAEAGSVFL